MIEIDIFFTASEWTLIMQNPDLYSSAHLIVAAIRVLEHKNKVPTSVDDVCRTLSLSLERGFHICRKLHENEIIDMVEGIFGTKLFIKNHLKIEKIEKEERESNLEEELKKFQDSREDLTQKVESIKAEQDKKQKDLFTKIEKQFIKKTNKPILQE